MCAHLHVRAELEIEGGIQCTQCFSEPSELVRPDVMGEMIVRVREADSGEARTQRWCCVLASVRSPSDPSV